MHNKERRYRRTRHKNEIVIAQSELEEGSIEVPFPGEMGRPTPSFTGLKTE